jgi:putative SOS response-associated peptidase YedK
MAGVKWSACDGASFRTGGESRSARCQRRLMRASKAWRKSRCFWTGPKGNKQPHIFTDADGAPILALAGLWDRWKDRATGGEIESCTLIVTAATEWMTPYHDRTPAVLQQAEIDRWLRGEMSAEELHPAPEATFRERKVSRRMNNTRVGDDDPTVLESEELGL